MFSACSVKSFSTLMIFWSLKKKKKKKKEATCKFGSQNAMQASFWKHTFVVVFFFGGGGDWPYHVFFFSNVQCFEKLHALKFILLLPAAAEINLSSATTNNFKNLILGIIFKIFNLLIESKIMQTHLNHKSVKFYVSTQLRKHLFLIGN